MNSDEIKISKFLSLVLRHKPETIGLLLDPAGWVSVERLLNACAEHGKSISEQQLIAVVTNNDKCRFSFSLDGKMIRANQGHSIDVELGYEPSVPPEFLYHGTATRFVESIKKQGLLKQARHHVHLTESVDIATSVGARYGKAIVLSINASSMYEDGHAFFLSTNNVWLTETVPTQYINFPEELS